MSGMKINLNRNVLRNTYTMQACSVLESVGTLAAKLISTLLGVQGVGRRNSPQQRHPS